MRASGPLMGHSVGTWVCGVLGLLSIFCAQSNAALAFGKSFASEILHMPTLTDWAIGTTFIFIGYFMQYVVTAGIFEYTHPAGGWSDKISEKEREKRRLQVKDELYLGVWAMLTNVIFTLLWMRYVEPHVWTYGYFDKNQYTSWWFFGSIIPYMFCFDTWFYFTHRYLHESQYMWDKVHRIHHGFKKPSAFAQDAAHPFEAAIQGPVGHYAVTLFFPMHPVAHSLFGFLSSIFAIAAHDGRAGDLNSHYLHHDKGRGKNVNFNYSLFWPFWDWVCGTRWTDTPANLKKLKEKAPEAWKAEGWLQDKTPSDSKKGI